MKRLSAFISAIGLVGCAATQPVPEWVHPKLVNSPNASDAALLETAECYQNARSTIREPVAPLPLPSADETTSRFSAGLAGGANLGASIAHGRAVNEVHEYTKKLTSACMRMKGWIDTSTPGGKEKLRAASAPESGAFDDLIPGKE